MHYLHNRKVGKECTNCLEIFQRVSLKNLYNTLNQATENNFAFNLAEVFLMTNPSDIHIITEKRIYQSHLS